MTQDDVNRSADARRVLDRFRQAAIDQSADELRRLFAVDAVHEFPFRRPGVPSRLAGRDEIVDFTVSAWTTLPLKYQRYRTLAIIETADPNTIVVEQEVHGHGTSGSAFVLPNIVVLTVRDSQILRLRDYVNLSAVDEAISAAAP